MFQDYALFPHRDVGDNVAFGLRMRGVPSGRRDERVAELLALVGLPGAERRSVAALSGGERQRVALARALAPAPTLLMLDEPLGALDRTLRDRLVLELGELFAEVGVSVLYVTHDQGEALGLAHRVVVMDQGRIVQQGAPRELWARPASAFVARFLGFTNLFRVDVAEGRAAAPWGGELRVDPERSCASLLVRPGGITLADHGAPGSLPARVTGVMFAAGSTEVRLELDGLGAVTALVDAASTPAAGARCGVVIDPAQVQVLRC